MNGTDAAHAQTTPTVVTTILYIPFVLNKHSKAAISHGNTQYPINDIACKKMIFPPKNFTFNVKANAPKATVANTTENTSAESAFSPLAFELKQTPNNRTNINGPHKSQSRNGCLASSLSSLLLLLLLLFITIFDISSTFFALFMILSISLFSVFAIGSSSVFVFTLLLF